MKEKAKEKVENELKDFKYLNELKDEISGYKLKKEMREKDEFYEIFSYENEAKRRCVKRIFTTKLWNIKCRLR